jgi:sugar phosphate isomerase/epimerase
MKKRNLLTIVLLIAITGTLSTLLLSFTPPKNKNIGLQLYSIRDSIRKNIPAAIEKVAKMGYTFVEPAGYGNGKFYGMDPVEFKNLCIKNGLYVLSSHTSQMLPSEANWDKTMALWDQCIDAHVAVGAKYIVQPVMGGDAYKSLGTLKKYCDYFNAVGEKCNAKGIKFGYHNHSGEFSTKLEGQTVSDSITVYDFMLKNTDPAKVFFQIDLYWCVEGGGNPVDYFNKYQGRFLSWHIKDEKEIGASGKMDFETIWAARKKSGMKYGVVEVERYDFDEFTSCKKSIDFLNAASYVKMPKK